MSFRPSYAGSVEKDIPRTIYFYATSHCNSNCSYCAFRTSNNDMPRIHMPLKTIKKAWLESTILRNCGIVVQGGEFTIHPEAIDIMRFFKTFLPKVTLLTNAVDPELAKPLIAYATQTTISLDGPSHDRARGVPGNLDNVFLLLEFLQQIGKSTTLQMTLGPWNAPNPESARHNIEWFLDVCVKYEAQPRFNIASDSGLLGIAHYEQKWGTMRKIYFDLQTFAGKLEYASISKSIRSGAQYIMAASMKMTGNKITCYSPSIYSTIGADGSVWLCQGLSEEEAVVGKIGGELSFDQIWSEAASKRKEYRECQACALSCQLNGDIAYMNSKDIS